MEFLLSQWNSFSRHYQALNLLDAHNYMCEIYGKNTDDQYVKYCKSLMKQNSKIYFKGDFKEQDKKSIIKSFSAMIISSIGHESFCLSLWEATTCGVPVMVPNFGVFKEFFSEKQRAIFFERNNFHSLSQELHYYFNHKFFKDEIPL